MRKSLKISILTILLTFLLNGCAQNSVLYGDNDIQPKYNLIEYFENPDSSISINLDDILIVTCKDGRRYTGKIVWIDKENSSEFDFKISADDRSYSFKYNDILHVQHIEYSELNSCFMNGINYADEVTAFMIFPIIGALAVIALYSLIFN